MMQIAVTCNHHIDIWDLGIEEGDLVCSLKYHPDRVKGLAFLP